VFSDNLEDLGERRGSRMIRDMSVKTFYQVVMLSRMCGVVRLGEKSNTRRLGGFRQNLLTKKIT